MTPEERVEVRQRRLVGWADEIEKRTNLPQHEMLTVARVLRETANDLAVAVAEERERVGWRNFKDRQPEDESVVLVTANGQAATIQYLGENWHWTHWMPYVDPEEDA